jgi:hypothetical protein
VIKKLTYNDNCVFVHPDDKSLKTVKAFTHGSIVFDVNARKVTFAKLPAVDVPEGLKIEEGATLNFLLMAPDGTLRKQIRNGVLQANEKQPGFLRIGGMAQSPRKFSREDGWGNMIYKYRAYFTHPGLTTDTELPVWLKDSIKRQKEYWNRLAWLCREARRKCSPVKSEEIAAFVKTEILPAIDTLNDSLGRSKDKMKHPAKLKIEDPGVDGLWKFAGELRHRVEKDRPVPPGLLEKVIAFAEQFKADYTALNDFMNNLPSIAEREAETLHLRRFEVRPTLASFRATLDRRKTTKAAWSEGWPLIKYPDSPKAADWGLHYYFNKAGIGSDLLEEGDGVPGLSFGPALSPAKTGHENLVGGATKRRLREAEISISGSNKERWDFHFGVLEHRPLPKHSHLKEWKLLFQDGALWLCLVVELQQPLPEPSTLAAGLDIGWRRTEEGIRFGTLYEPATKTIHELIINFQRSPKDPKQRVPFRIDLGPTRWEKRNIIKLLPKWKPGDGIPNSLEIKAALQTRRDYFKDTAKILLCKHLGEKTPAWLDKAGRSGLLHLKEEFKDDADVQEILNTWATNDEQVGKLASKYSARVTRRVEYGQQQVAHDVCRYLQQKDIARLVVEKNFLAKIAQHQDNSDPESLKRSQKYRQFAAVGRFVSKLKDTAVKYGQVVDSDEATNTTRMCQYCNHLNPATEKEKMDCEGCGREIKLDDNAAINLSRFASDPELAELAHGTQSKAKAKTSEAIANPKND